MDVAHVFDPELAAGFGDGASMAESLGDTTVFESLLQDPDKLAKFHSIDPSAPLEQRMQQMAQLLQTTGGSARGTAQGIRPSGGGQGEAVVGAAARSLRGSDSGGSRINGNICTQPQAAGELQKAPAFRIPGSARTPPHEGPLIVEGGSWYYTAEPVPPPSSASGAVRSKRCPSPVGLSTIAADRTAAAAPAAVPAAQAAGAESFSPAAAEGADGASCLDVLD